ncbi:hypothetical protein GUITHDRAFT_122898 [Guillardia theta CCMP2712]|uniref:Uncharacterized protein n=1 Tax=Guillardia theta (strain CCMP2712) TaxID=905079 RepID=L1I3U9_GUITC|nr:hypothetical protein GUITHDRAFT_122898 [Guillardia theta CCMP2712]EKX30896.1 hypothetical protein GUITHDRAFT_122898 [Guillardia theta CCMP2712]|eukprot:XP_005817876.1 hypothetical protein GUITHDRAFT_122898 [Guillardia theta CCMP2712]
MQTFLLLLGSIITCAMAMARVGGLSGLFSSTQDKRNLHLLRSDSDTPYSLLGLLLGAPFLIGWYHCCNQDMVQRGLAAKDMEHAKGGCVMAGWLKLLPPFLFLLPGMAARLLFPQELQCHTTPSSSSCSNPDAAFPLLVHQLIPAGLRGLVLAAVLAAMMSTLASAFNSSSTLFTMDIYLRARPSASSHELVLVGKACTLLLAVLAVLWVPVIKRLRAAVYVYAQMANGCLSPPIFTLFCLSLSSSSLNSAGALAGLSLGHLLGFTRMAVCIAMGAARPRAPPPPSSSVSSSGPSSCSSPSPRESSPASSWWL